MNKRANLYLDIYEVISFILALACMGLCMTLGEVSFPVPELLRTSILVLGLISSIVFIAIEVFLFLLMNVKARIYYIVFLIIDLLTAILINKYIPFSAFLVFILFSIIKDIGRILLVEKIYIPKEFNRYCKMFNIKIKDFPKKRAVKKEVKEKENNTKEIFVTNSKKNSNSDKSFA